MKKRWKKSDKCTVYSGRDEVVLDRNERVPSVPTISETDCPPREEWPLSAYVEEETTAHVSKTGNLQHGNQLKGTIPE